MATITESLFITLCTKKRKCLSEDYFIPDEVLMEILLRLPLLSLQLFKSVSKHWLSLITSPYFLRHLQKPRIDTPCGLFIRKHDSESYDFVSLGPKVTSFPLRATIAEPGSYFDIVQSCNGLLLCNNAVSHRVYYYVYNPFTNIFKNIPFPRYPWTTDMILAFDPTKSPYYKLVISEKINYLNRGWKEDSDTNRIQIYSSETGKWSICGPPFPKHRFCGFLNGIYWNKAIHWINYNENLHSKFDIVDHPIVTNIQTPALDDVEHMSLFESRGSLLLFMEDNDRCYHIFEMREESSEWSVKYIVDDLTNIVPPYMLRYICVMCIVLGERGDDPFMVIESYDKIIRYNLVSKTVSTLRNLIPLSYYSHIPFIASLAGV